MVNDPDLSLKEALHVMCPDTRPTAPLALPRAHNMGYPWLPYMPQQVLPT
jgi:hypothetical protein